jgi:hypothetical protein
MTRGDTTACPRRRFQIVNAARYLGKAVSHIVGGGNYFARHFHPLGAQRRRQAGVGERRTWNWSKHFPIRSNNN